MKSNSMLPTPMQALSVQTTEPPAPMPLESLQTAVQTARAAAPPTPEPLHQIATASRTGSLPVPTLGQATSAPQTAPKPMALEQLRAMAKAEDTANPVPSSQLNANAMSRNAPMPQPLEHLSETIDPSTNP